ncbi:hypothetical protein BKA70DRAFT_175232 [Coprinopsis sp. MPI-PUGE-AT-0042]|nr:hypothetical protein BKA70DRAFT_175232 [Coprinopsis sp. MPI-PUGE-AT-0042]
MSSATEPEFEVIRSIRFPPPPPTHNSLTPSQRAQLIRKTRKLEQILGVTPHLLDEAVAPIQISFPSNKRSSKPRLSEDSFSVYSSGSSSASSSACSSPTSSCSSASTNSSLSHKRSGSGSSLSRSPSATLRKSPPSRDSHNGPRLRLADQLIDDEKMGGPQSPSGPSNTASATGASRKNKMDRIRKRLGEDVPVDLVFPARTGYSRRSASVESVILVDFPTPRVPRTKKPLGTIAGARNSLVEVNGIHKAPRSSTSSTSSSCSSSSSPSSSPIDAAAPPLPPKSPSALRTASKNESLLAIFESPDENCPSARNSGCAEVAWSASEIKAWSANQECETWPTTKREKRSSWTYKKHDLVSFIDVGA